MQILSDAFKIGDEQTKLSLMKGMRIPSLVISSFQCSPLSTAENIEQTFQKALQLQKKSNQEKDSNTLVTVLLDEIGLADQSPFLPLKVLHKVLEDPQISVVGISNWKLDPAKMNRAVTFTSLTSYKGRFTCVDQNPTKKNSFLLQKTLSKVLLN